jgi:hypothetical protein
LELGRFATEPANPKASHTGQRDSSLTSGTDFSEEQPLWVLPAAEAAELLYYAQHQPNNGMKRKF